VLVGGALRPSPGPRRTPGPASHQLRPGFTRLETDP
jgi:hypothetical protein